MNGHRTIVAALTVCAVLLALNLMVTTAPASPDIAPATANANGPPAPTIVKLLHASHLTYHRFWSDGRHDQQQDASGNCDYTLSPAVSHGPVEHPFPLVDAVQGSNHSTQAFMLTYEDGRVDLIGNGIRCTIAGVGTPSFCTADVDRNGSVGIEDFLMVLAQWGCQ